MGRLLILAGATNTVGAPSLRFLGKGGCDSACTTRFSGESKSALHAESRPPFAKNAKNGAPTVVVIRARSKAGPRVQWARTAFIRTLSAHRRGRRNESEEFSETVSLQLAFFHLLYSIITGTRGQRHVGQRRVHARR